MTGTAITLTLQSRTSRFLPLAIYVSPWVCCSFGFRFLAVAELSTLLLPIPLRKRTKGKNKGKEQKEKTRRNGEEKQWGRTFFMACARAYSSISSVSPDVGSYSSPIFISACYSETVITLTLQSRTSRFCHSLYVYLLGYAVALVSGFSL